MIVTHSVKTNGVPCLFHGSDVVGVTLKAETDMASIKPGLRKRRQVRNVHGDENHSKHAEQFKALDEKIEATECSAEGETPYAEGGPDGSKWEERGRAEIKAAIDDSLAEYGETCGSNVPAWRVVEGEYMLLCEQLVAALARDKKNQGYNARTSKRRLYIALVGIFFLLCPTLVAYDIILSKMISADQIWILQNAATMHRKQANVVPTIVQVCSYLVVAARAVGHADEHNGRAFTTGSLGALLLLLIVLRVTARQKRVMTQTERKKAVNLIRWVDDDLKRRREQRRQSNKVE